VIVARDRNSESSPSRCSTCHGFTLFDKFVFCYFEFSNPSSDRQKNDMTKLLHVSRKVFAPRSLKFIAAKLWTFAGNRHNDRLHVLKGRTETFLFWYIFTSELIDCLTKLLCQTSFWDLCFELIDTTFYLERLLYQTTLSSKVTFLLAK